MKFEFEGTQVIVWKQNPNGRTTRGGCVRCLPFTCIYLRFSCWNN